MAVNRLKFWGNDLLFEMICCEKGIIHPLEVCLFVVVWVCFFKHGLIQVLCLHHKNTMHPLMEVHSVH